MSNPFVPGTRVAIKSKYDGLSEGFVDKVYKSGRFILRGSTQQYRPDNYNNGDTWNAWETGDGWFKRSLRIWNAETDSEILATNAANARKAKWHALKSRIERMREGELTDAMLEAIEAALPPVVKL